MRSASGDDALRALRNITIKLPTEEEMRETSLVWHARIGPTLLDQWPQEVHALSMPTKFFRFPMELLDPLFEPSKRPSAGLDAFAAELDAAMGWNRHFIRLNSRSPKDACWPAEVPITCSGREALMMLGGSERALDDLCLFRHIPEHPAYVCLRDLVYGMRPAQEYRCFVKDGDLIAVTNYDYLNPHPGPSDGGREIREQIDGWFAEKLRPRLHLQTVVFDVLLRWHEEPMLIELNPYGLSDPCYLRNYDAVENFSGFVAFLAPDQSACEASDAALSSTIRLDEQQNPPPKDGDSR